VQGGKPIIEHESVGLMLAEMAMLINALEASLYDVAYSYKIDPKFDGKMKARFAVIFPREVFVRVMVLGLDIVASAGIMRDHPMEKLVRDGLTFLHGSGTASINKLKTLPLLKKL
jgi:acyl-CoA dehydrogenase